MVCVYCLQDKADKDLILNLLLNLHDHLANIAGSYNPSVSSEWLFHVSNKDFSLRKGSVSLVAATTEWAAVLYFHWVCLFTAL